MEAAVGGGGFEKCPRPDSTQVSRGLSSEVLAITELKKV